MRADVMEKWTAELESGKYRKTTGFLRKGEKSRCCLGVLCDIYKEETGKGEWVKDKNFEFKVGPDGTSNDSYLPYEVQTWAGMVSDNGEMFDHPVLVDGWDYQNLSEINDETKASFKKIAEIIRKNVEVL